MAVDEWAGWVTTGELLDAARRSGFTEITERRLETWRNEKLLPRPQRVGQDGRRPRWLSPPETLEVLLELCELRDGSGRHSRTMDNTSLRLRRWLCGPAVSDDMSIDEVRAGLLIVLDDVQRVIDAELATVARCGHLAGTPREVRDAAIAHLAHHIASSRRLHELLPRPRSLSGARRERCLHALLHAFHTGQAPSVDVGMDLYRALGLRPLRGAEPLRQHHTGPPREPISLDTLADIASLAALRRAVETASDDDLLRARATATPFMGMLTWISRALSAAYDAPDLAGFRLLATRPRCSYHDTAIIALVLSFQRSVLSEDFARTAKLVAETSSSLAQFLKIATGPGRARHAEMNVGLQPWQNRVVEELSRPEPLMDPDGRNR